MKMLPAAAKSLTYPTTAQNCQVLLQQQPLWCERTVSNNIPDSSWLLELILVMPVCSTKSQTTRNSDEEQVMKEDLFAFSLLELSREAIHPGILRMILCDQAGQLIHPKANFLARRSTEPNYSNRYSSEEQYASTSRLLELLVV